MFTAKELFQNIKDKAEQSDLNPYQRIGYILQMAEQGVRLGEPEAEEIDPVVRVSYAPSYMDQPGW